MELDIVLRAVFAPALAVCVAALLLHVVSRAIPARIPNNSFRARAVRYLTPLRWMPLLLVLSPVVAHLHLQPGFAWPCTTSYAWLPVALVIGAVIALITGTVTNRFIRVMVAVVAATCTIAVLTPPTIGGVGYQLVAALIAAMAALGTGVAARPTAHTRVAPFIALWIVAACASVLCVLSGFAKLGIVVGALSAGSAALAVASAMAPSVRLGYGGAVTIACTMAACMFIGAGYDESGFPLAAWAAVAISPAFMAVGELPVFATRPRTRWCVTIAAPAVVALCAVVTAFWVSGLLSKPTKQSAPEEIYTSAW